MEKAEVTDNDKLVERFKSIYLNSKLYDYERRDQLFNIAIKEWQHLLPKDVERSELKPEDIDEFGKVIVKPKPALKEPTDVKKKKEKRIKN